MGYGMGFTCNKVRLGQAGSDLIWSGLMSIMSSRKDILRRMNEVKMKRRYSKKRYDIKEQFKKYPRTNLKRKKKNDKFIIKEINKFIEKPFFKKESFTKEKGN
jgi:hypothetical protein